MNVIICWDELAENIGPFATSCALAVGDLVDKRAKEIRRIESPNLHHEHVKAEIMAINQHSFIFTAFSHGSYDSLIAHKHGDYISTTVNSTIFGGSFFYTWACSSGNNLGRILTENKCRVYIGYWEKVYAPDVIDQAYEIFVDCATSGLRYFLEGKTAVESFNAMKNLYEEKIRELRVDGDAAAASKLSRSNRLLEFHGEENCTYKDFINE